MGTSQHDKFFSRALLMLQKLSNESSVSIVDLAQEYGVNKRTIYRDIKRLHFFPLELENGIVSVTEGFNIEHSKLADIELLVAELAFNSIDGLDEKTDKYLESIRAKLSNPLFFTPYHIKAEGFESINMDSELLNKIEDAIEKRNVSTITNNSLSSKIEPYKIVAFDGLWYLLAKEISSAKVKTYLLSNVEEFRSTKEIYLSTNNNIKEVLNNVHTAWFEDGNTFEVKVKVKKSIAHFFKLKKHFASQEILQENNDGSLLITFKVSTDEDVDNLIKAWLPHIEIIEPKRFRDKLILELECYLNGLKNNM